MKRSGYMHYMRITRKAISQIEKYKSIEHYYVSKGLYVSIWYRPDIFQSLDWDQTFFYQITMIYNGNDKMTHIDCATTQEAWEKLQEVIK